MEESNIKISVIIPIYNVEKYLAQCLDSITRQTLEEIEIICVNDGSTDSSGAIIETYMTADGRIRLIEEHNGGASCARNAGMRKSCGRYLYFMDSDDYLEQNALEELYKEAEREKLDLLCFDGAAFGETKEMYAFKDEFLHLDIKNSYDTVMTGEQLYIQMNKNQDFKHCVCLLLLRKRFLDSAGIRFYEGSGSVASETADIIQLRINWTIEILYNMYAGLEDKSMDAFWKGDWEKESWFNVMIREPYNMIVNRELRRKAETCQPMQRCCTGEPMGMLVYKTKENDLYEDSCLWAANRLELPYLDMEFVFETPVEKLSLLRFDPGEEGRFVLEEMTAAVFYENGSSEYVPIQKLMHNGYRYGISIVFPGNDPQVIWKVNPAQRVKRVHIAGFLSGEIPEKMPGKGMRRMRCRLYNLLCRIRNA